MITRELKPRWVAGDGSKHDTVEEAQKQDLIVLLSDELAPLDKDVALSIKGPGLLAGVILARSKHIVDILTTTASSLPKARVVNGGKKTRKAKVVAAQAMLPGTNGETTAASV